MLPHKLQRIDWILISASIPLLLAGLVTMYSFSSEAYFFQRQVIWILLSFLALFGASVIDWRFLRRSGVILSVYATIIFLLFILLLSGVSVRGAQSWFIFGGVSVQPADFVKIALILVLAKYFSRRHIEIANIRHILISGLYALVPFVLVFLQPDFGSAVIIFSIWLGMIIVSGVSKKHLLLVFLIAILSFGMLWIFGFTDNQKARVVTFLNPYTDLSGSGYNAFQSTIAVGSGGLFGKGVGYGTQSRLAYLPEYETDFIFAAFAEEWGFVGVLFLFLFFGILLWRIFANAFRGDTNFEVLFGLGLAIMFMSHFVIHVGMNIGLLPVTGLTFPFLSYGGSHLLASFLGVGILLGMRAYAQATHKDVLHGKEFIGFDQA